MTTVHDDKLDIVVKCPDPVDDSRTGEIELVVAAIGTPDRTDDIFVKGSVGRQPVMISGWHHSVWSGATPIGAGEVYEEGDQLKFKGKLNMELAAARDVWSSIDFARGATEVSIGFRIVKASYGEQNGRFVRYLEDVHAGEVSPVVLGAGAKTGVAALKDLPLEALDDGIETSALAAQAMLARLHLTEVRVSG